jgi:hypothetical protein
MNGLNLDLISDYSGVGANTDFSGLYNQAPNLSGFGSSGGGGGGGFGNFLNSNFMSNVGGPLLSAGLSGIFTNRAADNYGRSAREAALLGGQAALLAGREAGAFSLLGEDLAQKRRQEDAIFQLNMQKSQPFQDLVTRGFGMQIAAQDKPGSEMRAGRFMTMFG